MSFSPVTTQSIYLKTDHRSTPMERYGMSNVGSSILWIVETSYKLTLSLKWKCYHFDDIFITGCTESCHFDNFCAQAMKISSKLQYFCFNDYDAIIRLARQQQMWYIDHTVWTHKRHYCPASRTTLVATRFRVAVICPIIQVPHCIRVFFYFVWFVFINHICQFYNELCTYCNILDIYLS